MSDVSEAIRQFENSPGWWDEAAWERVKAALDALEAELDGVGQAYRGEARHADELQARLDAATELIRNMIAQDDRVHEVWDGLDEGPCPVTAPFRAWLSQGGPR